jgi:PAS domain-containing protein
MDPEQNPVGSFDITELEQFGVQSMLSLNLEPLYGPNWILGIHHCSEPVLYDQVCPLYHALGKRIGSGLTTILAMEKLQVSENRFRAIFESAPVAVTIVDVDSARIVAAIQWRLNCLDGLWMT